MAPVGSPKPTSHIVLRIVRVVISCVQDSTEKDRESPLEIWHFICHVHLVNTAFIRMLAKRRSLLLLLADKPVK